MDGRRRTCATQLERVRARRRAARRPQRRGGAARSRPAARSSSPASQTRCRSSSRPRSTPASATPPCSASRAADKVDARARAARAERRPRCGWKLPSGTPKLRDARRATARATSRSRASARGARRSRSCTATRAGPCRCREDQLPVRLPDDLRADRRGQRARRARGLHRAAVPAVRRPRRGARPTRSTATSTASWQWLPFSVPAAERESVDVHERGTERWLPVHIVIWGADGGGSMFDQRMTAKVLRDLGVCRTSPTASRTEGADARDGPPRRAQDEQAPRQRRRPGRAARARRRRHGAAGGALRGGADEHPHLDRPGAAVLPQWLHNFWSTRCRGWRASARCPSRTRRRARSKLRRRLDNWHGVAVRRITENMEGLETHRAARNVMTLVERDQRLRAARAQSSRTSSRRATPPRCSGRCSTRS